ncbi:MAG: hypothetical protein ACRDHL_04110 [Candidatus Promineifilaceae bacterium]
MPALPASLNPPAHLPARGGLRAAEPGLPLRLFAARREWGWALLAGLLFAAVLALPYLLGYGLARPGEFFTGVVMNPEDSQTYFAKMVQGHAGLWQYSIPFTPEPHQPAFVGGFYLALGQLARWLSVPLIAVWHGSRLAMGLLLALATFLFCATFLKGRAARWTGYVLALTGSGLGWLLLVWQPAWLPGMPMDFRMPEAHLFFTGLTYPHVAAGTALLLLGFWLFLQADHAGRRAPLFGLLAGLTNLGLAIAYPYLIYLVVATLGLYALFGSGAGRLWRRGLLAALALGPPTPLIAYYAIVQQQNPVFRRWAEQAVTPSPAWPHFLFAFGPLLLLALPALGRRGRSLLAGREGILWAWLVAAGLLLLLPLYPQRRFVQGAHAPLSILAAAGLFATLLPAPRSTRAFRWLAARPRYSAPGLERWLLTLLLAFMALSNVYLLADVSFSAAAAHRYPFFRSTAERQALAWLDGAATQADVIMASYETGNYVAGQLGLRVVVGHWAETADWDAKMALVERFYAPSTGAAERRRLLEEWNITLVWWGAQERQLAGSEGELAGPFEAVYSNDEVTIYAAR